MRMFAECDAGGRRGGVALLAVLVLASCKVQRPGVEDEAARLTGIENAIVFRTDAEPLTAGSTPTLSPAEAIRLTLAHDPRIQASLAHVRIAEADANQSRLLPNPILTVDVRLPVQSGTNTAAEATLTGDLVALLQKPGQIAAADKRLRASASDALVTVLDVISEVQIAYSAARAADAQVENAERRLGILQRLRDIAQKRLAAGDAVRLDVLTLDAQLMQARLDLADLELQRTEQRLLLARLVGQPRSAADWQLSAWQSPDTEPLAAESAWIDAALANRPEIATRVWELKALGDDYAVAAFSPFVGNSIGAHAEHDQEWRIGPTLSTPLPIFDFGQASRAKVKAQQVAARHELAKQQFDVIQDVRLAYATRLHSRRALTDAHDQLLPLQTQQLEQAQLAYKAGEVDLSTLLLAQTDLQGTLSKVIDLQEKATVAQVKLQRAAGGAAIAGRLHSTATTHPGDSATTAPTSQPTTGPAQ